MYKTKKKSGTKSTFVGENANGWPDTSTRKRKRTESENADQENMGDHGSKASKNLENKHGSQASKDQDSTGQENMGGGRTCLTDPITGQEN